jgi:hypothetical protein
MAALSIYAWPQFKDPRSNEGLFTSSIEGKKRVLCYVQEPPPASIGKPAYCDEPDVEIFSISKFGIALSIPFVLMILAGLKIGSKKR